jgi:hypothetical protein
MLDDSINEAMSYIFPIADLTTLKPQPLSDSLVHLNVHLKLCNIEHSHQARLRSFLLFSLNKGLAWSRYFIRWKLAVRSKAQAVQG